MPRGSICWNYDNTGNLGITTRPHVLIELPPKLSATIFQLTTFTNWYIKYWLQQSFDARYNNGRTEKLCDGKLFSSWLTQKI